MTEGRVKAVGGMDGFSGAAAVEPVDVADDAATHSARCVPPCRGLLGSLGEPRTPPCLATNVPDCGRSHSSVVQRLRLHGRPP